MLIPDVVHRLLYAACCDLALTFVATTVEEMKQGSAAKLLLSFASRGDRCNSATSPAFEAGSQSSVRSGR
jgi:hypothetical protein